MTQADVVITGTVLTVDDARPTAEALAVADGRIVAVGTRDDVAGFIGADTQTIDVADGCIMPGFVEAHGHPLMEAVALSDRIVDIRPVTIRAQTIDAAWQLFADDVIGSLQVGKYADMVVLSADPRTVPPERIADLDVRATFLAGRQVYRR
jgi:predicted amidohydrolase YtcJ